MFYKQKKISTFFKTKGVVLYRGFSVQEACHQIFGNSLGADKGLNIF